MNGNEVPKDEHAAFLNFEAVANSDYDDDGSAALKCADCCNNGIGVDKDPSRAFKYYLQAAEKGNIRAQYCVGVYYFNGDGIEEDCKLAIAWFKKAAENGDLDAQFGLA